MEIFAINKLLRRSRFNRIRHIKRWQTLSLLLLFLCGVSATGFSQQDKKVSFGAEKEPLTKVLDRLAQTSGVNIVYPSKEAGKFNVSLSKENRTLGNTLQLLLKSTTLDYEFVNGKVVVFKKKAGLPKAAAKITVKGLVTDEENQPLSGITVLIKGSTIGTATNNDGTFQIDNVPEDANVELSSVGYEKVEQLVSEWLKVTLIKGDALMENITVNTGYQTLPKERATGSFVIVDSALFNRRVSPFVLDRLDGVASGVLFQKSTPLGANEPAISIRGRSTIFSNTDPLIVLDNFPYDGDLNNINPNDVENITILKDAAAASIWGVRAANGVIVITTKKGKLNEATKVSVNMNITVGQKPNLYYLPRISSSDYVAVQEDLYKRGYYTGSLSLNYAAVPPVAEILKAKADGKISEAEANSQLDVLRNTDIRNEIDKYFNRKSVNQQYAVTLKGGGANQQYYLSAGFDKNLTNTVTDSYRRLTLNARNSFFFIQRKLEFTTGILFSNSKRLQNNNTFSERYPYLTLSDENGNALPVALDYSKKYIDEQLGLGYDIRFKPLEENSPNTTIDIIDYRINALLKYQIFKGFYASADYQYSKGAVDLNRYYEAKSYYARNNVFRFMQVNGTTITYPLPKGGILQNVNTDYITQNFRGQLSYNRKFGSLHDIAAIAGYEIKDNNNSEDASLLYGYDSETATSTPVDYFTQFRTNPTGGTSRISPGISQGYTIDRFRSYYVNASYSYDNRYIISGSARRDESNLFGVKSNQKGVPLWSVGTNWNISKEPFYHVQWLKLLKLKATYGYNGNINKRVSAYTTAGPAITTLNSWGANQLDIINPPNPTLRWEKIAVTNFGVDFAIFQNNIDPKRSLAEFSNGGH